MEINVQECVEQVVGVGILFVMIVVIIRDVMNMIYVVGKNDCQDIVCFYFFMVLIVIVMGDILVVFRNVISLCLFVF